MADQSWFPFAFIAAMILMGFVVSKIGGWFGKKYNTNSIIPLTDPVIKADKYIYTDDNGINHDISHDQIVEIIGKSERDFWDRVHGKDIYVRKIHLLVEYVDNTQEEFVVNIIRSKVP